MTYLIDTNICIYLVREKDLELTQRFEEHRLYEIGVSAVTVAELQYGVAKSRQVERNRRALLRFLTPFEILPFDDKDAELFGILRARLEAEGRTIGPYDLELAAQALARGLILVTNNEGEFRRIPGLPVENWTRRTV
ncbi:MAG: PIN domain-containing protein [Spirochaetes bacterium]|jgi:tRNA(fMet)-specific endonuclease VapC|nr:PIN domain-containing protein [Spirochaetota bacterium]